MTDNRMKEIEIDEGTGYTGFDEALQLVKQNVQPVGIEERPLTECTGYVCAEDGYALISNPRNDSSLKDGFAVRSSDISKASDENPVTLGIVGSVFAGGLYEGTVSSGEAVRICSGAPIPNGADAVVAEELCDEQADIIRLRSGIRSGQNIIPAGEDIKKGEKVISNGQKITPPVMAYLAVAGIDRLKVYRKPRFALLSIGDEIIEPGTILREGRIFASNLVYNGAWMDTLGIPYQSGVAKDDESGIRAVLEKLLPHADAVITSGGVMHSERDLIVGIMNDLGWDIKFRHVRMGPGKATAFGLLNGKPVFCFSGGPSSNALAFLQFALPGIYRMQGITVDPLDTVEAQLTGEVKGRNRNWTEFREGKLEQDEKGRLTVTPLIGKGRIGAMAEAECLICKPEECSGLEKGHQVKIQILPRVQVCRE